MPRAPRQASQTGFYHATVRGSGRRMLFEDDSDRRRFLERLARIARECQVEVHAWCLMSNHAHLLLAGDPNDISHLMQRFETGYSRHYNGRHGHAGPVFEGRYGCEAIDSEEHLLAALRYIHQNPIRAGESTHYDVPWSSYAEYTGSSERGLTRTSFLLDMLGGVEGFAAFHEAEKGLVSISLSPGHRRLDDSEARRIARRLFGPDYASSIALLPKEKRDDAIRILRAHDLSIRQIERLTGIGRNIVAKA